MRKYHAEKMNKESAYPYQPWQISENEFLVENNHHNEAIFSLGNGYMGLRGTLEEDYAGSAETTTPGFYINGVYASEEIIYGEEAPSLPRRGQTMINLADWSEINLYINEEKFNMLQGHLTDYIRKLDLKKGVITRSLIWEDRQGRKVKIKIERLISFTRENIAAINYSVQPLNFSGKISIQSAVNGDVSNFYHLRNKKNAQVLQGKVEGKNGILLQKVKSTGFEIGFAVEHILKKMGGAEWKLESRESSNRIDWIFNLNAIEGEEYSISKIVAVNYAERNGEKPLEKARAELAKAAIIGYDGLSSEQTKFMQGYWEDVDIEIKGDPALQQAFRFNSFHILQSTGRNGRTSVAAKGLTGEYYEGHYFWDTETYILPFYIFQRPEVAKNLLLYRYYTLDKAKINARRMRLDGALYPWRTINGNEASGFFMGSTVQYHIDADIAYAIYLYYQVTGDQDFIDNYGLEIFVETARMWASRGSYIEKRNNKFCFNVVCGPDEYKPGVNNNAFTNYMAKFNLEIAAKMAREVKNRSGDKYAKMAERVNLDEDEVANWKQLAEDVYLPFDEELNIIPQDDSFLYKDPIHVDSIPVNELPLVKNWHPLIIWRYQVIKQADVILLMLLLGAKFSQKLKKANYDFYEPKTTHDSSLSPAIYSIIANEIGYAEQSFNYFMQTARLDLDDYNENAYQGVHTACMGGTWLALIQGFGGMRVENGNLYFNPTIPKKWDSYKFRIRYKKSQLEVEVNNKEVSYLLLGGEKINFTHRDQTINLSCSKLSKKIKI